MTLVIRSNIKLATAPGSGTGDDMLTRDSSSGAVGIVSAIDTSNFVSSTLASARLVVGNASNEATAVDVTGDVTISNTGVTAIGSGVIVNADVNASAAIALSKLAATTASRLLVSDASGFVSASSVTATEAGYLSGVTSAIQTQLGAKVTNSFTTNRALISNGSGNVAVSSVTSTELGYVSGVTSALQTQLDAKQAGIQFKDEGSSIGTLAAVTAVDFVGAGVSAAHSGGTVTVTIAGTANGQPSGGSAGQFLTKIDGTDYNSQWTTLTTSLITDVTATAGELNILDGATLTTTELNYVDGVSSSIQTQLDGKLTNPLTTTGDLLIYNGGATRLGIGSSAYVLTVSGGLPVWTNITAGTTNELQKNSGSATFVRTKVYSASDGTLTIGDSSLAGARTLTFTNSSNSLILSANPTGARTVTIQDGSGTLAFLSDIAASGWAVTGTTTLTGDVIIDGDSSYDIDFSESPVINLAPDNVGLWSDITFNFQGGVQTGHIGIVGTEPSSNPTVGAFFWGATEPEGGNLKIRTSGGHFAKPVLQSKVTVSGGATLQGIGSTPVTILAAPGAGFYLNILGISVSYNYGTTQYDFAAGEVPQLEFNGASGQAWRIPIAIANQASDFNIKLSPTNDTASNYNSILQPVNTALVLTTDNSGDASAGDGDWDVVIYYTIETSNT